MGIDFVEAAAGSDLGLDGALAAAWQIVSGFRVTIPRRTDLFVYFRVLNEILVALAEGGEAGSVEAIMGHVHYLADKGGCSATELLSGCHFNADSQVIIDALSNIRALLQTTLRHRPQKSPDGVPDDVFDLILEAEAKLSGWCSREKGVMIARMILRERPKVAVEIGVFGGRSLMPAAAALRHLGSGEIYGIEAWNPSVATENATSTLNDDWWLEVDFPRIKQEFYRFLAAANLTQQVRVIEAPSKRAASLFDMIDFLHIDGSHSIINAAEDVILYATKVRRGGIVLFDDINWKSTAPARELLSALCDTEAVLKDMETGEDCCAVMRRR